MWGEIECSDDNADQPWANIASRMQEGLKPRGRMQLAMCDLVWYLWKLLLTTVKQRTNSTRPREISVWCKIAMTYVLNLPRIHIRIAGRQIICGVD
jgi:hypothetical protein